MKINKKRNTNVDIAEVWLSAKVKTETIGTDCTKVKKGDFFFYHWKWFGFNFELKKWFRGFLPFLSLFFLFISNAKLFACKFIVLIVCESILRKFQQWTQEKNVSLCVLSFLFSLCKMSSLRLKFRVKRKTKRVTELLNPSIVFFFILSYSLCAFFFVLNRIKMFVFIYIRNLCQFTSICIRLMGVPFKSQRINNTSMNSNRNDCINK